MSFFNVPFHAIVTIVFQHWSCVWPITLNIASSYIEKWQLNLTYQAYKHILHNEAWDILTWDTRLHCKKFLCNVTYSIRMMMNVMFGMMRKCCTHVGKIFNHEHSLVHEPQNWNILPRRPIHTYWWNFNVTHIFNVKHISYFPLYWGKRCWNQNIFATLNVLTYNI